MRILNIAGYKFIKLADLPELGEQLHGLCADLGLMGTILLSPEGVNMSLAGTEDNVKQYLAVIGGDVRFADMSFHQTYSTEIPFRFLRVKQKKEIITMRQCDVAPVEGVGRAPDMAPETLKQWLDEKRDFTLLDTRNDFEYRFGTFEGALNLNIEKFTELPDAIKGLDKDKPVVMFCTGGIRCEKAAIYMLEQGFKEVYQLDGGILGYFAKVGGAHYHGECFVFDTRIALNPELEYTGTTQCDGCQGPIAVNDADCRACA